MFEVSRALEIDKILKHIEAREDVPGLVRNLALHFNGIPREQLTSFAVDLWGFLTLNLQGILRKSQVLLVTSDKNWHLLVDHFDVAE